jgi:hypothetical protein
MFALELIEQSYADSIIFPLDGSDFRAEAVLQSLILV